MILKFCKTPLKQNLLKEMESLMNILSTKLPEDIVHFTRFFGLRIPIAIGRKNIFVGDVVPQLQQLRNKFIAKYDFDGRKSMQLRQQWKELGELEKWTFLFYHDIKTPVFKPNPTNQSLR